MLDQQIIQSRNIIFLKLVVFLILYSALLKIKPQYRENLTLINKKILQTMISEVKLKQKITLLASKDFDADFLIQKHHFLVNLDGLAYCHDINDKINRIYQIQNKNMQLELFFSQINLNNLQRADNNIYILNRKSDITLNIEAANFQNALHLAAESYQLLPESSPVLLLELKQKNHGTIADLSDLLQNNLRNKLITAKILIQNNNLSLNR